ncbi:hypothetical protein AB4391_24050 [Vibrio lentus]|uniref:Transglycosylase SLT domain-containing protein n=1 Tax=Vibrio lentus TaxID=136468 RepID=A0A2N7KEY4_9VIBR|nr:hypothetical protein [Vibrio lentus]PMM74293.1 hypothetical protein BCT49_24200 [Vibrio lentus]
MDAKQLTQLVVRPTLQTLGLHSKAAEQLIIGTIFQESRAKYLKQIGAGPALGIIQMEPATYHDIWKNYLGYKNELSSKVRTLASVGSFEGGYPNQFELVTNLAYAVAMCRIFYRRKPYALPVEGDVAAMAEYWKVHYNTVLGAGTEEEFIENFPNEILDC